MAELIRFETRHKQTGEPISAVLEVHGDGVDLLIDGRCLMYGYITDEVDGRIDWRDDDHFYISLISLEGAEEVVRAHMAQVVKSHTLHRGNVPEFLWKYIERGGTCLSGGALSENEETDEDGNDDNTTSWRPGSEEVRLSDTYTLAQLREIIAMIERINASLVAKV